jgi:hypothetical protein
MVSVVICSADPTSPEGAAALYQRALYGADVELVCIRDARGLCDGYNRGLARSRGVVVIFSHEDWRSIVLTWPVGSPLTCNIATCRESRGPHGSATETGGNPVRRTFMGNC